MLKLETASVSNAADALSLMAFMPYPCLLAGIEVSNAILTTSSQNW